MVNVQRDLVIIARKYNIKDIEKIKEYAQGYRKYQNLTVTQLDEIMERLKLN